MHDRAIPSKTAAGRDEIEKRSRKLSSGLRSILLLIDGQRSARDLKSVIAGVHAPADALEQLVELGLIAEAAPAATDTIEQAPPRTSEAVNRYNMLYALMSDGIREHLGLRGYFVQLKVERSGTVDELLALLPDLSTAVTKAKGSQVGAEFEDRLRLLAAI